MTGAEFRKLALSFSGAIEKEHMGHPDFRAGERGKIFASLGFEEDWGMVKLTPERQAEYIEKDPEAFRPAAGAWGLGGSTIVTLAKGKKALVKKALSEAWENVSSKK